jgi:hypothetical protein
MVFANMNGWHRLGLFLSVVWIVCVNLINYDLYLTLKASSGVAYQEKQLEWAVGIEDYLKSKGALHAGENPYLKGKRLSDYIDHDPRLDTWTSRVLGSTFIPIFLMYFFAYSFVWIKRGFKKAL